jgi:bifunctional non-homologous end joining protein LigD
VKTAARGRGMPGTRARPVKSPVETTAETQVAGVRLTHPDRVLYPEQGLTKRDLARFYEEISDWILPHVVERPLSLVRCPEGRGRQCFFQKHATPGIPEHLKPVRIKENAGAGQYLYVESEKGLVSLVQMCVLEIHPWGSRLGRLESPDLLSLDLDPAPGVPWARVTEAARRSCALLEELGLTSFVKTTGGKGLHVVVPLAPRESWLRLKQFSQAIAEELARRHPKDYTANLSKSARVGKIFVDYLRNARGATAVAAYSTRAREGAPVSTPLAWDELGRGGSDRFTVKSLPKRLATLKTDPWAGYFKARQGIPRKFLAAVKEGTR